jgi:ABC-type dipeptide/oligopeptide/nickel transport system ATPase subunit
MNDKERTRTFDDKPAIRERVPLLIGLFGPSGGGKTFTALRLATGIQKVTGGDIYVIDTEARRALHYADLFRFRHLQFDEPYGSLDYLAAIRHCVAKGAKIVVVDSMSHEHSGVGGYLDFHEREVDRMAGDDAAKRERVNIAGWIKPAQARKTLIDGVLHLNANFVFAFRSKEKIKPVPGKAPQELGWMPIAGDEFLFEMTVNCLLLPKAGGVPTWRSDLVGERLMMKLPERFAALFPPDRPIDENAGTELAQWAQGDKIASDLGDLPANAMTAARKGRDAFRAFWKKLSSENRGKLSSRLDEYKLTAEKADLAASGDDPFAETGPERGGSPPGVESPDSPSVGAGASAPPQESAVSPPGSTDRASFGTPSASFPGPTPAHSSEPPAPPESSPPGPADDPPASRAPRNDNGRQRPSEARREPNEKSERDQRRDELAAEGAAKAEEGSKALIGWMDTLSADDQQMLVNKTVKVWMARSADVDAAKRGGRR